MHRNPRVESITSNIPPKGVIGSDFICTFTMPDEDLFDFYSYTKLSESSDMAKYRVIYCYSVFFN